MHALLLGGLVFLATSYVALGIACTEHSCDNVRCAAVTPKTCNYTIVEHGGFCGCCDACVHYLKEGEDCPTVHFQGGPPPTTLCGAGLTCCSSTGKCVKSN